jgi:bis(5'-nucleosyl)-tetraphosphatase (symmetrical)
MGVATYVIGDVHGCLRSLLNLVHSFGFEAHKDRLWFVGDLVNKGPDSLGVLRWVRRMEHSCVVTLGNHDLHFLGRYFGVRKAKPSDTLDQALEAEDVQDIVDWLLHRPLICLESGNVLVHAGILPTWSLDQAVGEAEDISRFLTSNPIALLNFYDEKVEPNSDQASGEVVVRAAWAARVLTCIRTCNGLCEPDFDYTGPPGKAPQGTVPWYLFPTITSSGRCFLFGHWAQHGFLQTRNAVCLDTACVYGGLLTAVRLEDGNIFQVSNRDGL